MVKESLDKQDFKQLQQDCSLEDGGFGHLFSETTSPERYSRRDFIKGIIASGVAVSGIPYMVS